MAVGKINHTSANAEHFNLMSECCRNFPAQSLLEKFFLL